MIRCLGSIASIFLSRSIAALVDGYTHWWELAVLFGFKIEVTCAVLRKHLVVSLAGEGRLAQ